METTQLKGRMNPGSGFVGNQYVMDLAQHLPQWSLTDTSPWGGLSGAAMFGGRLLTGVVASDRAHSAHGQLNVVPAYVLHHDPAFRAVLAEHGGGVGRLEAVEFQHLQDPASTAPRGKPQSPAALLEAGRETVPFHGREDLLEQLRAWCAWDGFGAWLLHGPGGQGKTRLAHQLAALLAADNWAVLLPRPDASVVELKEIRHATKPLLVVLDYAETRTSQLNALIEAAADRPGATPLKILLLARTDGDWWTRAKTASSLAQNYLDTALTHRLPPLEDDPADRPQAYHSAASALATVLPCITGAAAHDWHAAAATLQAPRLDQDGYGNALTLQMTALADLLDTVAPADSSGPAQQGAEGVEDRLLGHEFRYWRDTATARGLAPGLSLDTLERALAAGHLVGAADREQADRTWCRIPELADQARDRRDGVTGWIGALYPPTDSGRPWGSLQPDRLAERHIGRVLAADPTLAENLLQDADAVQAAQLLTNYSRAAAHPVFHGSLDTHLTDLCVRRHHQLAKHVIATAIQTDRPAPLITALEKITTDQGASLRDLTSLQSWLPESSRRLVDLAVRLAREIVDRYRVLAETGPTAYRPPLAAALNNLSVQLSALGSGEEGLAAIEEAVDHYRALAKTNPDMYLSALAGALNNLAVDLGKLGRGEEGLVPVQEAVRIRRLLGGTNPDAYLRCDLAVALTNLSNRLDEVGRREEGLAAIKEAVDHFRILAKTSPDAYLLNLASALNNLSVQLSEVGRGEESLTVVKEAVSHYRVLAENNSDAHLPDLAMGLNNLSALLGAVGRGEESLTVVEEAVDHYRLLAKTNPGAHLPNLATSLNNLSNQLGEVGRGEDGLAAIEEAVGLFRVLAGTNPGAYLPSLARTQHTLANRLREMRRWEDGLAAIEEAVGHFRVFAEGNPGVYLSNLALALKSLSNLLGEVGRGEEGLVAIEEAVGYYRTLAKTNPHAYLPHLAQAMNNISNRLDAVGRGEESLAAVEEAVDYYRTLAENNSDLYLPNLATGLNNLSAHLGAAGRGVEGLPVAEEAVGHFRALTKSNASAYLPKLAMGLNNLSNRLGEAGRREEGVVAAEEAVGHYRLLAKSNPDSYLPYLATSLNNLSVQLGAVGRGEEGVLAAEEAAYIRRSGGAQPSR
ncbi:tetratricopeptide repeat protein [Streptomyces sp. NPDC085524]|uniref:tetratricopeptide repeat protein n=1 Tax=Streptomyces sp. NPDC085524 TaxID=3365728 RepID=UPI0037D25DC6